MSDPARKVTFHGAFTLKADAQRRERALRRAGEKNAFVKRIKTRAGQTRYAVLTEG